MTTSNKLETQLQVVQSLFNTPRVAKTSVDSTYIAEYYHINVLPYTLVHSKTGAIHMAISRDGTYKESDLFEPVRMIAAYVEKTKATHVLELACGRGANSSYLAERFPKTRFEGVDLSPAQLQFAQKNARKFRNFHAQRGDYHDLSQLPANHFDLVFVIESLCYSTTKEKVIKEVKRVLKPNGIFIVIDGYLRNEEKTMQKEEVEAVRLAAMGMAVPFFEPYDHFLKQAKDENMKLVNEEDLSEFVMPNLYRFEKIAKNYLKVPFLVPAMIKFLPEKLTWNGITAMLLVPIMERNIACYYFTALQKH